MGIGNGLLDSSLFESITLSAVVKNKTTMKDILPTEACGLVVEEILDDGIVLTVPGPSFARDHKIIVKLQPMGGSLRDPPEFVGTGVVRDLVTFPDGTEKVVVRWTHFNQDSWSDMWSVFEERQKQIEKFLEQIKG